MLISKNFLTREASYKPSYFTSWSRSGPAGTLVSGCLFQLKSGRTSALRRPHSVQTKSGSTSDSARGPA